MYQIAMQTIFDDMLHKIVECYVDDLAVKSKKKVGTYEAFIKFLKDCKDAS